MADVERGRRRGRFSSDAGLKKAIRELAIDTLGGARAIAAALNEEKRPSYGTVRGVLKELGFETREKRVAARRKAGRGEWAPLDAVGLWEEAYLESREWTRGGRTIEVSYILDRATASAYAVVGKGDEVAERLVAMVRAKEGSGIRHLMIGRGGKRRKKIGLELEKLLVDGGTAYKVEGRWGAMSVHRDRLLAMIDEGLSGIEDGDDAGAAVADAVRRYNEEVPYDGYPTFGDTPGKAWVRLKRGIRPGTARTTRGAKRG